MRLRQVTIGDYKNLKDFTLEFEGEGFIDVFVGRNGSGKSNFLEALVRIYDHLLDFDPAGPGPGFDYLLAYEIDGRETLIEWRGGGLAVDGADRRTLGRTPQVDTVIVYYSGQNRHIAELIGGYEARFRRRIRGADLADTPRFIGIGPDYKQLLILLLLLLPEERQSRRFIESKLGILGAGGTAKVSLSRPTFATRRDYDHLDPSDLFWGLQGVTRAFLDDLIACIEGGATPGALHDRDADRYTIEINAELFRRRFAGRPWDELFRLFNNLRILGMLADVSMPVTLGGLESSDLGLFSDGQFQSVYLFAIAELFKDRNCVTLLDEPDAFLHPEWQFEFLQQTEAISADAARTNHILMSSHSAATLIPSLQPKVKYFDLKDGRAHCYSLPKRIAVERLSAKLIRYTEEEQLLSILNAIGIEKKPVLFTEGSIDPLIITEAWNRLFEQEMPFIPFYAFSCTYLKQLLQDDRILNDMGGRPAFGLFDYDQAYDQWNGLRGDLVQSDPRTGACKKLGVRNAYAFLLPLPDNPTIRAQVIKNAATGESFGGSSLCEIEHLFYGDAQTAEFFTTEPTPGGGTKVIIRSDAQKERFARDVVPKLDDRYFQVFKPMFDFIVSKI